MMTHSPRQHLWVLCCVCALCFGCASARKKTTEAKKSLAPLHEALTATPIAGFVVVPFDQPLFVSEEDALAADPVRRAQPATGWLSRAGNHLQEGIAYAVVEDRGDVIEVATIASKERAAHCARYADPMLDLFEVRLFVPRRALLPVLTEVHTEVFDDGTGVSFAPGATVQDVGRGASRRFIVSADGVSRAVALDLSRIALSYTSTSPFLESNSPPKRLKKLPVDTVLWIDGAPTMRAEELDHALTYVREDSAHGEEWIMVGLSSSCMRVAALTPEVQIRRSRLGTSKAAITVASRRRAGTRQLGVRQGTEVWWERGQRAGVARLDVWTREDFSARDGRYCFSLVAQLDERLCVREEDAVVLGERDP